MNQLLGYVVIFSDYFRFENFLLKDIQREAEKLLVEILKIPSDKPDIPAK